jgi:dipeptidyl aminopeptidase/acylaminoacyl peptidase
MRFMSLLLLMCTFLPPRIATASQIEEKKAVELPAFDSNPEIALYAERSEYEEARADSSFRYERMLYKSGDAIVSGYLYSPVTPPSEKQPVIIFCRGGYVVSNQAPVLLTMIHRLAREGFLVFAPMLRGSDGTQGHDEMGGADLNDLRATLDLAGTLPGADVRNIFLYGESRGAMMTYFALRDGWPVQAAAIFGGITDLREYMDRIDPQGKFGATVFPDYATKKEDVLRSRSAIDWPEKIRKPILIMHGGADQNVSPMHALKMAEALTKLQSEYSLVIFAGDNHILSGNRNRRDALAVEWFRRHAAK